MVQVQVADGPLPNLRGGEGRLQVESVETSVTKVSAGEPVIRAQGLHKAYAGVEVLRDVDIEVRKGETIAIVGPSGSGKTTLLRCMNLLVEPDRGVLHFQGELVGRWDGGRGNIAVSLARYRSRIGFVFQHFELFPHLSVIDNVTLGPRHVLHESKVIARERGLGVLDRVGLRDFADRRPKTLSGGQRQRVAIARALAMRPEMLLFDEPTSALDAEMVDEVLEIIKALAAAGGTLVMVTHELGFAREVATRVIVMENGVIVEEGATASMFESAQAERARAILNPRSKSRL